MANEPSKLNAREVFTENPFVAVIEIHPTVVIVTPITVEVWYNGVNQPSVSVTPTLSGRSLSVPFTVAQLRALPAKKATYNVKFGSTYVIQQELNPTKTAPTIDSALDIYAGVGSIVNRVTYFSDLTTAKLATEEANRARTNADLAQTYAGQAQNYLINIQDFLSTSAVPKGGYNASTGSPSLSSVLTATGHYVTITTAGTQTINGVATALSEGWSIIRLPDATYFIDKYKQIPAPGSVDNTALKATIKLKNFPLTPTSDVLDTRISGAFRDIKLYNVPKQKQYTFGIILKNVSGVYRIRIYEWTGSVGTEYFDWNPGLYTPAASIETLKIPGKVDPSQSAVLLVDWSQIPDNTNISSITFNSGGISPQTYIDQSDYSTFVDDKLAGLNIIPPLFDDIASYTEVDGAENVEAKTISHASVDGFQLIFTQVDEKLNCFSFPGHNFSHATVKYAFAVVFRNGIELERKRTPFDKRTTEYSIIFSKTYNRIDGITIRFGYCDEDWMTLAPGTSLAWASSVNDTNLVPYASSGESRLFYYNGSSPVDIGGAMVLGASTYKGTPYRLSLVSDISLKVQDKDITAVDVIIPPKLYTCNAPIWIYPKSYIKNQAFFGKKAYGISISAKRTSDNATFYHDVYDGRGQLKTTSNVGSTAGGTTNTLTILDYGKTTDAGAINTLLTKTFQIITQAYPSSKTVNAVFLGDSYAEKRWPNNSTSKGLLVEITDLLTNSNVINWKGDKNTDYGVPSPSRAGWSETTFVSSGSPFYNAGSFSWSYYVSTYSIGPVNTVIIELGKNGTTDGANIQVMIDSIHAADPTIKIIICTVPGAGQPQANGFDSETAQLIAINKTKRYIERWAGLESSNIYLCPAHLVMDLDTSFKATVKSSVQFTDDGSTSIRVNDDVHPSDSGRKALAYILHQYIMYVNA